VLEGLLLPGRPIHRRCRRSYPNLLPPLLFHTGISHSQVFLTYKELNFHSRFAKFLVDSGASISILLHSSWAPPTGPQIVGANGKQIPAWGLRHRTVCFSGHNFKFDFLLAAVATPILVMDFQARFELSIIPAKQQVLHEAAPSPRQVPLLLVAPGVLRPPPPSPLSRPRYNNCSRNSRRCCVPAPPLQSRSTASYITSTQVSPPPCSPALDGWTRRNTASPTRNFSTWRKQVLFTTQTRLGRPRCTWSREQH
jgi:hypothetical protein